MSTWALWFINPSIVSIASVYWADSKIAANGGVYATFIADVASDPNAAKYQDIMSDADWAYVVTWSKMLPRQEKVSETQVCFLILTVSYM